MSFKMVNNVRGWGKSERYRSLILRYAGQGRVTCTVKSTVRKMLVGWLFWVKRPFETVFQSISDREGEREERIEESKIVQTPPTRTYCKRNGPLSHYHQNRRTPRHWKFTQDHRITRPPQAKSSPGSYLSSDLCKYMIIYLSRCVWNVVQDGQ